MSKSELAPQPLWNDEMPPQDTLWMDALNNRGFLAQPSLPNEPRQYEGLPRVISTAEMAAHIGRLIAPVHSEYSVKYEAPELGVSFEDLKLVDIEAIESGLYIPTRPGKRFREHGVSQAVRVYHGHTSLDISGVVPSDMAVAFHEDDYRKVAHSSRALRDHTHTKTLSNNPIRRNTDNRQERERKSTSSVAKQMTSKIAAIDKLAFEIVERRDNLRIDIRSFRSQPPVRYLPSNAAEILRQADTELRRIVEVSGQQRKLTPDQLAASQRALTVNLYQRGMWPEYIKMGGFYLNAQLGKLDESRNACLDEYRKHRHAIKPAEIEFFDAAVYRRQHEQLQLVA